MNCVGKMLGTNEGNTALFGFNSWHLSFCCSLQENIHQLYVRECSDYIKYWYQSAKETSMLEFGLSKLLKKKHLMCILILMITEDSFHYRFSFCFPPWFMVITVMSLIFFTTENPLPSVGYVIFST